MKVIKTIEHLGNKYDLVRSGHALRHPCKKCVFRDPASCLLTDDQADCIVDEDRTYFIAHKEKRNA